MTTVGEELKTTGLSPNKALGQNFLCDENAISAIVGCAAEPRLPLLEVGPGLGALTLPLVREGLPLAAVELDHRLAEVLSGKLEAYPNAHVIEGDFLKTDLASAHALLGGGAFTAVGNLPYYITSPICERLVLSGLPIERMVLMMQREAGERFFAAPGDKNYGPLTVTAQCLYSVRKLIELDPSAYYPQPEVSSVVLVLQSNGGTMPRLLPRLLKCAFAMRRKTLCNNLSAMGVSKAETAEHLAALGLKESVRAEALDVSQFIALADRLDEAGY